MKGQHSGSGSTLKTAFHVSKCGALIGGQAVGLLGLSYSLRRVRGERSREQQYPLVTLTRGPRMFFCWFLVVKAFKEDSAGYSFGLCWLSFLAHREAKQGSGVAITKIFISTVCFQIVIPV